MMSTAFLIKANEYRINKFVEEKRGSNENRENIEFSNDFFLFLPLPSTPLSPHSPTLPLPNFSLPSLAWKTAQQ